MFKTINSKRSIDEACPSFSAFLYCRLANEENNKLIRFWGRAIDYTFVSVVIDTLTYEAGYSSIADFFSAFVYISTGCVFGSFTVYAADHFFTSNKKMYAVIILFLTLLGSILAVGYAVYLMKHIG